MYKYFVSYQFNTNNSFGFGRCGLDFENKINTMEDIAEIEKMIIENNKGKMTSIIILNYKLLKEDK